jgi:hypothetical protein
MNRLVLAAALAAVVTPLSAQPNPFKPPKPQLKEAQLSYSLTGDITGNAMVGFSGERIARHQTSTVKMMGRTTTTDEWTLTTADSMYRADLGKKQGTVSPNILPYMAKAYDHLDGAGKQRLHQNMQDMAAMLARAFSLSSLSSGDRSGTKSYAGQECEERKFGSFSVCTMTKAPVLLHAQGSLVCLNYEETATEVKLGAPAADLLSPPPGITWKQDGQLEHPDSTALGFVSYLASQQLADSIAKAKQELAQAQAGHNGQPTQLTPEQQASMQQACDALKHLNLDVGKAIADAANQALKDMADVAKQAASDAAKKAAEDKKNEASNKIKGLFKKPKIP